MKSQSKPNISPLEIEIESKLSNAYLFAVAARAGQLDIRQAMAGVLAAPEFPTNVNNQISNN